MGRPIKVMIVYGTRPEVIKLAPVALLLKQRSSQFNCRLVSTGQHRELSRQAGAIFGLEPDIDLDLMAHNQSSGSFVGLSVAHLDRVIASERPDWIIVQGDTATVLAGALAAYYNQVPVAHLEAGLRSGDLTAPHPEEGSRQMVGRVAALHFVPTLLARDNLLRENIPDESIIVTGNTVIDAMRLVLQGDEAPSSVAVSEIDPGRRLVLVTLHRRESLGQSLLGMLEAIRSLALVDELNLQFIFPVHPNPLVSSQVRSVLGNCANVILSAPLDYVSLLFTMQRCWLVMTDSGGLQEEAPGLGVPVLVLRDRTERQEGVDAGVARLVGTDKDAITGAVYSLVSDPGSYLAMKSSVNPYGDGYASERVVRALEQRFAG